MPEAADAGDVTVVSDMMAPELDTVQDFITKWGLRIDAEQKILSMPAELQHKVIAEFKPRDTSRDANNVFLKFADGIASGAPRGARPEGQAWETSDELAKEEELFTEHWILNEDAQRLLRNLEPQTRSKVMKEFQPRDAENDVNNVFMKFAQTVDREQKGKGKGGGKGKDGKGKGKGKTPDYGHGGYGGFPAYPAPAYGHYGAPPPVAYGYGFAPAAAYGYPPPAAAGFATGQTQAFIAQWQLGPQASDLLNGMGHAAQQKVMAEFNPRDTSRDVNGIFLKFADGIASGVPRTQANREYGGGHSPAGHHGGFGGFGGVTAESQAADFVVMWSLGEEAQQIFNGLSEEHRQRVMTEFSPRDTSSDVNNIFMKFCQGMSKGKSKGKGKDKGKDRFSPY